MSSHGRRMLSLLGSILPLLVVGVASAQEQKPVAPEPTAEQVEFFEKSIRPVLVERCYKCHSADSDKVKGGLLVDTREGLIKGGDTGPAIVPGNPDKSLLIQAIRYHDEDLKMPPKEQLSKETVAAFEKWVKMGAPDPRKPGEKPVTTAAAYNYDEWKQFWSFKPVKDQAPPAVRNDDWVKNEVDRFVIAAYEAKGLKPVALADKRTLIRRATYDLTGLPPTPEEVEAFVADESPTAFERVVDRLLASPHYGEKWGRHWLDLARYADTSGCNSDFPIPSAYRYRNYVIDSFNKDKPYNLFLTEQLAGDMMPSESIEQKNERIVATGYLAIARRFGSRASEFHLTIEDIIDNVGKSMLGLSINCARCHDAKYDPIPTADYYALYGIFNSTRYAFPGTEIYRHTKDFVPIGTPEEVNKLLAYEAKVTELDNRIEDLTKEMRNAIRDPNMLSPEEKQALSERLAKVGKKDVDAAPEDEATAKPVEPAPPRPADLPPDAEQGKPAPKVRRTVAEVKADQQDAQQELRRLENRPPDVAKAYAVVEGLPHNVKIHKKGDLRSPGDVAPRGFLTILGGAKLPEDVAKKESGRMQLAQWITDPSNPLTARVMANRIWQHHYGRGIVQTPNDFGARGKAPTHPALLDYLAARFVQSGWSVKAMHKLVMLSRTYQLASLHDSENGLVDPSNDYLWRFNPRRLSAEEVRDSMLFLSGALDETVGGGSHPFPPENEWRYTQHRQFVATYEGNKRSVYLMQQRIKKHPFLEVFDGADTNASTADRPIAITPIQALFMMNDALVHDLSDKFAVRVGLAFSDEEQRIDGMYRLALARPATAEEIQMAKEFLRACTEKLKEAKVPWDRQGRAALASLGRMFFSSNEFFFVD
jgi:hypothetical protein